MRRLMSPLILRGPGLRKRVNGGIVHSRQCLEHEWQLRFATMITCFLLLVEERKMVQILKL